MFISLIKFIMTLLIIFIVFLAFLPNILSTSWGQETLLEKINSQIDSHITIKKIDLSWIHHQQLESVEIIDPQGNTAACADKIVIDASLGYILKNAIPLFFNNDSYNDLKIPFSLLEKLTIHNGHFYCQQEDAHPLVFSEIFAHSQRSQSPEGAFTLCLSGASTKGEIKGQFEMQVDIYNSSQIDFLPIHHHSETFLALGSEYIAGFSVKVRDLPIEPFDNILADVHPEMAGILTQIFGPFLSFSVDHQPHNDTFSSSAPSEIRLSFHSDKMSVAPIQLIIGEQVSLSKPIHLLAVIDKEFVNTKLLEKNVVAAADEDMSIILKIDQLSFSPQWSRKFSFDTLIESLTFDSELFVDGLKISGLPYASNVSLKQWQCKIKGAPRGIISSLITGIVDIDERERGLSKFIGNSASFQLDIKGHLDNSGLFVDVFQGGIHSSLLQAFAQANVLDNNRLTFNAPVLVNYTITKDAIASLHSLGLNALSELIGTTSATVKLYPQNLTRKDFSLPRLLQKGEITIDKMVIKVGDEGASHDAYLNELLLPWEVVIDRKGNFNKVKAEIIAQTMFTEEGKSSEGSVNMHIDVKKGPEGCLDCRQMPLNVQGHIIRFPISFVETIFGSSGLTASLGHMLDLSIDAKMEELSEGKINFAISSDKIKGKFAFVVDKEYISLKPLQNESLKWQMTPRCFQLLKQWSIGVEGLPQLLSSIELIRPATITFEINALEIPFPICSVANNRGWKEAKIDMNLAVKQLALHGIEKANSLEFENIEMSLKSDDISKDILFKINANDIEGKAPNSLKVIGRIEDIIQNERLSFHTSTSHVKATINQLALPFFFDVFAFSQSTRDIVEAAIGKYLTGSMLTLMHGKNGVLQAYLAGENGGMEVDAKIYQSMLTLNSPFNSYMKVSPKASQAIFCKFLPLFDSAERAETPIQLTIEAQGFSFPLENFDFKNVNIAQGSLTLGKLYFNNNGRMAHLLNMLDRDHAFPVAEHTVWFTPLYFQISQGAITCHRMDMLVDNTFPFAIWGAVDMPEDKVDMQLGISAQALEKAFSIEIGNPNYMLVLPLKGTLAKASIDKAKATSQISTFVMGHQRGAKGLIIGGFLKLIHGRPKESYVPPPTTIPIPWQV